MSAPVAIVEYQKDENQNEIYPRANNADKVILNRYARDKDQIPFYPKDVNNNEFMDLDLGLIERNGEYVYPKMAANGRPRYRDDPNDQGPIKTKIYEKINGQWIIGRGLDGHQYYATKNDGSEYYPENNMPAQRANGTIYYARDFNRNSPHDVIFPKNADGDEYYLTFIDLCNLEDTNPGRYAHKKNGDEIYPQRRIDYDLISDYIINNRYIKCGGKACYPRDAYNNEFYIDPEPISGAQLVPDDLILENYAVTNDGKVILPGINNTFYIYLTMNPIVTEPDILGKLVRERKGVSSDYLTKVEISNKPKVEPKKYKYLDFNTNIYKTIIPAGYTSIKKPFFKTWYFWIVVVVSLILQTFGIWWIFFRQPKFVI